jgi:hypothetical protein
MNVKALFFDIDGTIPPVSEFMSVFPLQLN